MTKQPPLKSVQAHYDDKADIRHGDLRDREKRHQKGKLIVAIAAVATAAAVLVPAALKEGQEQASEDMHRAEKLEQEAQKMTQKGELNVSDNVIVLGERVRLRSSPHRSVPNPDPGGEPISVNNIVHTVEEGTKVVADRPLEYVDEDGETWIGFNFINNKGGAASSKLAWVNTTALINQENNSPKGEDLIGFHMTTAPIPQDYTAFMHEGNVVHIGNKENTELFATGQVVRETELASTLQTFQSIG